MNLEQCNAYIERDHKVLAPTTHLHYFPLVVRRAYGSTIEDADGNKFIDFLSSASCLNLGSSNKEIIEAIIGQLNEYSQYTNAYAYNVPAIEYAERLIKVVPGDFEKKVIFGLCGSDANDAAIKFSRAYTGRTKIISFINGYYGSSYGAISLSAVSNKMRKGIGPLLPDILSFPFSNCYRCLFEKDEEACNVECLDSLLEAFRVYLPPDEVAAVIIEPIQGDGGLVPASKKFINKLYKLCKDQGILFFSEEVQQAFGRTGKWFAIENYDIIPDGVILGKSIGGLLPLGAFIARSEILDSLPAPAHMFTYGGNALSCVAGIAQFDIMEQDGFFIEVINKGDYIKAKFHLFKQKYKIIGDIRGLGLSIGVEIVKDLNTLEKDAEGTLKISYRAYQKGLILIYLSGNVLRIQPPLTITYDEIDQAMFIIDEILYEYVHGLIGDDILMLSNGWH
jgi:4-aminobutyrate aminotransferase